MKKLLFIPAILSCLFLLLASNSGDIDSVEAANLDNGGSFDARINTFKYQLKQEIKPCRYEGSRVTLYNLKDADIVKSVDAYLILDTEYKFAFSGKECSTNVSVKIYESEKKSALLKEIKNIKGKNIIVSSNDLMSNYKKKVSKNDRIKSVYIEYTIASGKDKNEAVVLVIGYKD